MYIKYYKQIFSSCIRTLRYCGIAIISLCILSCTQEQQNKISRQIQNWTGTDGVLEVYAGPNVVRRFIKIDKMSAGYVADNASEARSFRYGYGYLDTNLNMQVDPGEKKVYFEVSDFSTPYVFFEHP